jgi:hypothetical protein
MQGRRRSTQERFGAVHARAGARTLGVRILQELLERGVELPTLRNCLECSDR